MGGLRVSHGPVAVRLSRRHVSEKLGLLRGTPQLPAHGGEGRMGGVRMRTASRSCLPGAKRDKWDAWAK